MPNKLLDQFNTVIKTEWPCEKVSISYEPLSHRALFEIGYHTANTISSRNIFMKLQQDDNKGGSNAVLYSSKNKMFISIEAHDAALEMRLYTNEESCSDKLESEIAPKIKERKEKFASKEKDLKTQVLKTFIVQRKLDECANLVMSKGINRKIYFAIGDARESAAVVPMFMQAEGASLVQLALNKWMETAQRLPQEETFPDNNVAGLLKNLMQIKKWILNLLNKNLD